MSNRAAIEHRFTRLQEIGSILNAMKGLALVETRKLARFIGHQRRMLDTIEMAAADFLQFFPLPGGEDEDHVVILVTGSERGFCGNFNERVLVALDALPRAGEGAWLIGVGHRLESRLAGRPGLLASLEGPSVSEDVPAVLDGLMDALHAARARLEGGRMRLCALAWEAEGEPRLRDILPMAPEGSQHFGHPPQLNLPPAEFFSQLIDQYLLAALYGLLYGSLAAENRRRVEHMESALDRLDEVSAQLNIRRNALRKEEIVEEIEVILSSALAMKRGREGAAK